MHARHRIAVLAIAALALAITAPPVFAGSNMDTKGTEKGQPWTGATLIDGGKMRLGSATGSLIVDLDAKTLMIVDAAKKTATQTSTQGLGGLALVGVLMPYYVENYKVTGHRTVAGYTCDEYSGSTDAMGHIEFKNCFAKDAPGAKQTRDFMTRALLSMGSPDPKDPAVKAVLDPIGLGVILASESVQKLDLGQAGQAPKVVHSSYEATAIKEQTIPADSFRAPAGYAVQKM